MVESFAYLRIASGSDAWALARLRAASHIELGMLRPAARYAFERTACREFADLFASERMSAWVLVEHGRVVGSACALYWQRLPYTGTSLHAELAGVYVTPDLRGHGYARELCREAIATARGRGVRHLSVHPSDSGRRLYAALGFEPSGEMRLAAT